MIDLMFLFVFLLYLAHKHDQSVRDDPWTPGASKKRKVDPNARNPFVE